MIKRFCRYLVALAVGLVPGLASASSDPTAALYSSINVSGIQSNLTALMITLLVIPVLFFGYRKAKQVFIK